jgi:outer membrane protein OmpA-like peptidoglycan-associated protein
MGFFVILLALNMGPKGTAAGPPSTQEPTDAPFAEDDVAIAIREAFNNPVEATSTDPNDAQLVRRLRELRGDERSRDEGPLGSRHRVQSLRRGEHYSVVGMVEFERDSSKLDEAGRAVLEEVANHVRGVQLVVEVRGHVSAAEAVRTEDRGMRLSFERAIAVGDELVKLGAGWQQLRLQACGDNERVTGPVYEWEGHKPNQRVEIIVLDSPVEAVPAPPADEDVPPAPPRQVPANRKQEH